MDLQTLCRVQMGKTPMGWTMLLEREKEKINYVLKNCPNCEIQNLGFKIIKIKKLKELGIIFFKGNEKKRLPFNKRMLHGMQPNFSPAFLCLSQHFQTDSLFCSSAGRGVGGASISSWSSPSSSAR